MKLTPRIAAVVLAVTALVVGWSARSAVSQSTAPTDRVGYLDIARVYKEYRKQGDTESRFRRESESLQDQLRKRAAELEKDASKLQTLNPESADYQRLMREVELRKYQIELDQKLAQNDMARRASAQERRIYKEICLEAQAYAERNNLAAVHVWRPVDDALDSGADLELTIATRTVIYGHESLDITDAVVRALNAALPPERPSQPSPTDPGTDSSSGSGGR